ncbi:unnamed protein product [Cyprideis torosa]|uniref:Large ribosomal subunit protein mL64 n=1 Tax=Cyprideis torosa TaxID=163714 RepID=A0A7R8WD04_9CRUS|nr:unnamed protein product [Cyprideis torosa]CAG0887869.1 unnamed protein product [Cyprideis torosa]
MLSSCLRCGVLGLRVPSLSRGCFVDPRDTLFHLPQDFKGEKVAREALDDQSVPKASRLKPEDWNRLQGKPPYGDLGPQTREHHTFTYQRKMFGTYGSASGINPGICWPRKDELEEMEVAEKLEVSSEDLITRIQRIKRRKQKEKEALIAKDKLFQRNMLKQPALIAAFEKRQKKILEEEDLQRIKKEELVEEVRAYFGYRIDPADPKFQEMVEKKKKEEAKREKELKKREKQAAELAKMIAEAAKMKSKKEKQDSKSETPAEDSKSETSAEDSKPETTSQN